MDYKDLLESFQGVASILAVDLKVESGDSRYKVVDGNEAYKRTVVKSLDEFEQNVPYTRYIMKAANFESLLEAVASSGKPLHTYFDIELYNAWMEVFYLPLKSDDPDRKLILFTYEMNQKANVDKLTDITPETATNVIQTCLKLRETDDFKESMKEVVKDIRRQCDSQRCSILMTDYEKRDYRLLCEDYDHSDPNQMPMESFLTEEFYAVIETWPKLINKSNCFIITSERDMDNASEIAPEWIASLRYAGISTIVIYPLRSVNKTIGYIWAGNFPVEKTQMIKETLGLTAFILSAEIANDQNAKKMKIMSSTDLLTGVYNRNAMNNRISYDINGENEIVKPFGVFFIDVNGLKTINDTQGHLAGDNLLKDVATTLKELKSDKAEIYRVGGDEFLIITPETTRDEFDGLREQLISMSERPGRAHYAVGACHSTEYDDVRRAMQIADARMYDVKEEYYSRHPEYEWHNKPV